MVGSKPGDAPPASESGANVAAVQTLRVRQRHPPFAKRLD